MLRISKATFATRQSLSFEMMVYLISTNQLSKNRDYVLMFNKREIFWISDVDYLFPGVDVLSIKIASKQIWICGRLGFGYSILHTNTALFPRMWQYPVNIINFASFVVKMIESSNVLPRLRPGNHSNMGSSRQ